MVIPGTPFGILELLNRVKQVTMKITQSTFIIEANGFADGPAQPFRDYLLTHNAKKIIFINHPLVAESNSEHLVTTYENGEEKVKKYHLPNHPPYTFIFDPFVPLKLPDATAWFGYNNLSVHRGLKLKKAGKVKKVYYWAVDFVPNRFGANPLTMLYNKLDKQACENSDVRIELSQAALDGRSKSLELDSKTAAPGMLIPMGTWLERSAKVDPKKRRKHSLVYMGHLVERQGVETLLRATEILANKYKDLTLDVVGSGPEYDKLQNLAKSLGIAKNVIFHGFVKQYEDVEAILARSSIAVAPYQKNTENFTQFADPGKLKAYLGAHLPIVLTDVPPNAQQLAKTGAATIVEDHPVSVATGIEKLFDEKYWDKSFKAVQKEAQLFDWNILFKNALEKLGFK